LVRPVIFISYAHVDEPEKPAADEANEHLPLETVTEDKRLFIHTVPATGEQL